MLVGVDIGGTKTHFAFDDSGATSEKIVPTESWRRGAILENGNIERLLAELPQKLRRDPDARLVVGSRGCNSPDIVNGFERQVRAGWAGPSKVVNDAELLAPAFGPDAAICLVAGTGSIVHGRDGSDTFIRVGGHGWMFDDFGSAAGLTREAVRSVLQARDAGLPRDGLAEQLFAHFGLKNEEELSSEFYARPLLAHWAAAAPAVFAAAAAGSDRASNVIRQATAKLAQDVVHCRNRGALGHTVICAGGVISHQPMMLDLVKARLAELAPDLEAHLLTVPPVTGALALARNLQAA